MSQDIELPHDRFGRRRDTVHTFKPNTDATLCGVQASVPSDVWLAPREGGPGHMCVECDRIFREDNDGKWARPPFESPQELETRAANLARISVGMIVRVSYRVFDFPTNDGYCPARVVEIASEDGVLVVLLEEAPYFLTERKRVYAAHKVGKTYRVNAERVKIDDLTCSGCMHAPELCTCGTFSL
jgi:hypothetical protein